MFRHIIAAIDVGSSTVETVIAERKSDRDVASHILGIGVVPSRGMRRGVVVDIEEATSAIRRSVEEARRSSGVSVRSAWVSVDGAHIATSSSRGVVAVSRADGEISAEDMRRALAAAETFVPKNLNKATIHIMPRDFRVDNEAGIKDPVGMHGVRLEVDALIVECSAPFLKNLFKCVEGAGIEVANYAFAPFAASDAILTKQQKELGVMLCDIGGGTTSFMVFEEGAPLHAGVIPIGGGHITNDIAIGFQIHVDAAEYIKTLHGACSGADFPRKENLRLADVLRDGGAEFMLERGLMASEEQMTYSRRDLAEMVSARLTDIFELLQKELKKIGRNRLLPAGIVFVGGGSRVPGLVDLARREMQLPVELGRASAFENAADEHRIAQLASAFGLILRAESGALYQGGAGRPNRLAHMRGTPIGRWLRSLIP
ncbi:MAG: cell division protein FtsA [Patescibacteria group bacterium]